MDQTRRIDAIDEALRVLLGGTEADLWNLLAEVKPSMAELDAAESLLLADSRLG